MIISKQMLNQIIIDSGSKKTFFSKEHPVFNALRGLIASTGGDDIDYNKVLLCFVQNPLKPIHPKDTFFTYQFVSGHVPGHWDAGSDVEIYEFCRNPLRDEYNTREIRAFFVLQRVLEEVQLTIPAYAVKPARSNIIDFNSQRAVLIACFISLNNPRLVKLFSVERDALFLTTLFTLVDAIFPDDIESCYDSSRYDSLAQGMIALASASECFCNYPNHSELFKLGAALGYSRLFVEPNEFFDALSSRADLNEIIDAINQVRKSSGFSFQLLKVLKEFMKNNQTKQPELFKLGAALDDSRFFNEPMQFFDALGSRADLIAIIDTIKEARKSKVAPDQLFTLLKTLPTDLFAQIKALEVEAHNLDARESLSREVFGSYWGPSGDRDNNEIYTKIQRHTNPILALQLIQLYNQFSIDKNDKEILLSHSSLAQLAAIQPQLTALQQSALVSWDAMLAIVRFTLKDPYPSDTMAYFMDFKRQVEQLRADGCSHAMIDLVEAQVILGMIRSVGSDLANEAIDGYLRALNTKLRAEIPTSVLVSTPASTQRFFDPRPVQQAIQPTVQNLDDEPEVVQGLA